MGMINAKFGIVVTYPDRREEDTIREKHRDVQFNCTGTTFFLNQMMDARVFTVLFLMLF